MKNQNEVNKNKKYILKSVNLVDFGFKGMRVFMLP